MRLTGIHYVVDENGRRKAVVIPYRAYLQLLEDIADLQTIAERRNEPTVDFETVLRDLENTDRV